jgi:hypothetical protein
MSLLNILYRATEHKLHVGFESVFFLFSTTIEIKEKYLPPYTVLH